MLLASGNNALHNDIQFQQRHDVRMIVRSCKMRVYLKKKDWLIYSHSIVVTLYLILDEIDFANGIYNDVYDKQTAIIFKPPRDSW